MKKKQYIQPEWIIEMLTPDVSVMLLSSGDNKEAGTEEGDEPF